MRKFGGLLTAIAIAIVLAAVTVVPSDAARKHHPVRGGGHGGGSFDGAWSVSVYTSSGPCGSYRAAVRISGGRVSGGGGEYSLYGHVNPSGGISVTVSSGSGTAHGSGRLHGSHGGGGWRSSGGECSGSWSASKRG